MNEINLAANKPASFYAIPVSSKNVLSMQPIQTVKHIMEDYQKQQMTLINGQNGKENPKRTVTVNGTGEIKMPPNEIKLVIVITSCKTNIEEAKSSVQRRYEYVYQTMRKYKINESNIFVNTSYCRRDDLYEVRCELSSILSDYKIYLQIYNILIEKLDKTVKILEPELSHSPNRIEALKRQATLQAIRNAKRTALDIAQSVGLQLGKPCEIVQESFRETFGEPMDIVDVKYLSNLINEKTIKVTCNVRVTFDLIRSRNKKLLETVK
ncbi:interleukin-1 receptor-associated kinase 1-binding 1 [Brachionus plicatilis]|uniref:Interleukin-1 receptor-associated kinase 1-binding 1 n=1 Tax=Brachionus plicatilis TaxID=10195 RepID=A0A3M7S3E7_BRAPC|nr:interleukin-1 receptor-associated kinase 1-binding 1 [Brachionus plicatilis]